MLKNIRKLQIFWWFDVTNVYFCFDLRRKKNQTFEIPTLFVCFWHVDFTLFLNLPISWRSRANAGELNKNAQKVIQPIVQQKEMTILHAFFESWMS